MGRRVGKDVAVIATATVRVRLRPSVRVMFAGAFERILLMLLLLLVGVLLLGQRLLQRRLLLFHFLQLVLILQHLLRKFANWFGRCRGDSRRRRRRRRRFTDRCNCRRSDFDQFEFKFYMFLLHNLPLAGIAAAVADAAFESFFSAAVVDAVSPLRSSLCSARPPFGTGCHSLSFNRWC